MGGVSSEREVSLVSGAAIAKGLAEAGYDVATVRLDSTDVALPAGVEAVFLALHGRFGEDGGVQSILDGMKMPYTGCGAKASALAFDKVRAQERFARCGLPVPANQILAPGQGAADVALKPPVVVKPPREGSSIGVSIVRDAGSLDAAIAEARKYANGDLLVEQYIPGREWTVGLVDGVALPPIQITPATATGTPDGGWYDYRTKYHAGGTTDYSFPGRNPAEGALCRLVSTIAVDAFKAVGARGMGRVDFRISPDGSPYILEINTLPGFTPSSLLPKAAQEAGMSFPQLCAAIMETAAYGE